ncbi:hypothetical protein HAX54_007152 [Datura stramonium]|uniref:Uncharacterized protein n=1 Tax=Datura stramonium TaxID=4076 RepID=A0ABS8WWN3_DATST|nr:hypothetical protein [Datura stramonium]
MTLVGKFLRSRPQIEKIRSKFAEKVTIREGRVQQNPKKDKSKKGTDIDKEETKSYQPESSKEKEQSNKERDRRDKKNDMDDKSKEIAPKLTMRASLQIKEPS